MHRVFPPIVALTLVATSAVSSGCSDASKQAGDEQDAGVAIPLQGEVGKWTWSDVPEAKCANGASTGVGLNVGTGDQVLIFLDGGGACWDEVSCFGVDLAANIVNGYTKANFDADASGDTLKQGVFDRTAPNNPFKDASIVYVPYCTGDVHAGDAVQTYDDKDVHFVGRKNLSAYVARIVATFKQASRVTLAGSSAGGFGALLNYWRVQDAFGKIRVDLIDDSGPPIEQSSIKLFPAWKESWNMDGAFPPDCADCRTNVRALSAYYQKAYPSSRKALLSFKEDRTISGFFLMFDPTSFSDALKDLTQNTIAPLSSMKYFMPAGSTHTMLRDLDTKAGDTELGSWLTQMTSDAADWQNVAGPE